MSKRIDVGYGHPPTEHQFKKGKSGNPKGRPKGSRGLVATFQKVINERITVVVKGRRRTITIGEAAFKQVANKAASGDLRALSMVIGLVQFVENRPGNTLQPFDSDDDRAVMAQLAKRFKKVVDDIDGEDRP